MKECPVCYERVARRVKVDGVMVCPFCLEPVEIVKGVLVRASFRSEVDRLFRIVEKTLKGAQDNIFPYRIPQHMILRTNNILDNMWNDYLPVIQSKGMNIEQAIELFELAMRELVGMLSEDSLELGLILWYISGKETNKFQRILTRYVMSKARAVALSAEPDDWLTY